VRVDLFDYDLPADRIAQEARPRGTSRLLTLDRATGAVGHRRFAELPELLRDGDLLVRNDVRVRPARLFGRDPEERLVEIFLLSNENAERTRWRTMARPGRRAKEGRTLRFDEGLVARVAKVHDDGNRTVAFDRPLTPAILERIGHTPCPVHPPRARGAGPRRGPLRLPAVRARAARGRGADGGLHFTLETLERIRDRGVEIVDLTLAVGAGTFKPVTVDDTDDHVLHPEEIAIPAATRSAVASARREGRRIVAVGTTVARSLEAAALRVDGPPGDLRFSTDLFITPGFQFRAIDALLTNFHLPSRRC
jgi:S-adenosylmethionine:tRNA ribosyltransferase-isomerase